MFHLHNPQGSTGSSTYFGIKIRKPVFFSLLPQNFSLIKFNYTLEVIAENWIAYTHLQIENWNKKTILNCILFY